MIVENSDVFRKNIKKKLKLILKKEKLSTNLEISIFNYCIKEAKKKEIIRKWDNKYFVQLYINRFRSIYQNINPMFSTSNKLSLENLINGKINATKLAFMTHQEMNPKIWKKLITEKIKRNKNMTKIDTSAATNEFTCYKCKKKQCTYYQLQTRSADEPMTTFVTCLVCGNRWKF